MKDRQPIFYSKSFWDLVSIYRDSLDADPSIDLGFRHSKIRQVAQSSQGERHWDNVVREVEARDLRSSKVETNPKIVTSKEKRDIYLIRRQKLRTESKTPINKFLKEGI